MEKKPKNLLIIFYRNPELGKVKTRLAATLGDERALAIYLHLVAHTRNISEVLECDRVIYYSDYIDREDNWSNAAYQKKLQRGNDLGGKMVNAFDESFKAGYQSVCIIGTDCLELSSELINNAFTKLQKNDAVIGPAHDGGYYLLGMNKLYKEVFTNKKWSTDSVCEETMISFENLRLAYIKLATLSDIDEEDDLPENLRNQAISGKF